MFNVLFEVSKKYMCNNNQCKREIIKILWFYHFAGIIEYADCGNELFYNV